MTFHVGYLWFSREAILGPLSMKAVALDTNLASSPSILDRSQCLCIPSLVNRDTHLARRCSNILKPTPIPLRRHRVDLASTQPS